MSRIRPGQGIRIETVDPGSPAEAMDLAPGDRCTALNGHPVEDFLDFQFYLREEDVNLMRVEKPDGELWEAEFELDEGESLGVAWEAIRPRSCRNRCVFCFVDQLPPRVRKTLRFKDEDFRHSFLHGNFIALGNLSGRDLDRIVTQRLSPLYVSVHTTNPELRHRMAGGRDAAHFFRCFDALLEGGITLHTQVVLCPGVNDGAELTRTINDLAGRYPGVQSVGIVPVGLTAFRDRLPPIVPPEPPFCREVIRQAGEMERELRSRLGLGFAYLADEFFLQSGSPIPPAAYYDGYPQLENGIGLTRDFLEEFEAALEQPLPAVARPSGTLATGQLFGPVLRPAVDRFNRRFGTGLRVLEVPNRFLGGRVTVAGLLSGGDILAAGRGKVAGDWLAVPFECLNAGQELFLDDLDLETLARELGRPVYHLPRGIDGLCALVAGTIAPVEP